MDQFSSFSFKYLIINMPFCSTTDDKIPMNITISEITETFIFFTFHLTHRIILEMVPDSFHDLTCTSCQVFGQLIEYKKSPRPRAKLKLLYFTFDKIALIFCTCLLPDTPSEKDEILSSLSLNILLLNILLFSAGYLFLEDIFYFNSKVHIF